MTAVGGKATGVAADCDSAIVQLILEEPNAHKYGDKKPHGIESVVFVSDDE